MYCDESYFGDDLEVRRKKMGHAYKILVIFENGDHEVLHYTEEKSANEAYDALKEFPAKLSFTKLYAPFERYRVRPR